jgi:hypothetical protein
MAFVFKSERKGFEKPPFEIGPGSYNPDPEKKIRP